MKRKKIKTGWLEYFNFSTRERRGAIFLSFIILIQIIFLSWFRNRDSHISPPDPKLAKAMFELNLEQRKIFADTIVENHKSFHPVNFDPNKIDTSIALAAGLTSKQTNVILNYLSKGGVFRTKKDFRKMYCITEAQFKRLEPFILLPDSVTGSITKKVERKSVQVDIGKADSVLLMQLRGIGLVFASRIIKYRELLGGFTSTGQLLEVYGMKDSLFNALSPFIYLSDTVPFRFIHLNTDSVSVLAAHPYVRRKLAGIIIAYRKQHPFTSVQDIAAMPLVTDEMFRKLAPYLKSD